MRRRRRRPRPPRGSGPGGGPRRRRTAACRTRRPGRAASQPPIEQPAVRRPTVGGVGQQAARGIAARRRLTSARARTRPAGRAPMASPIRPPRPATAGPGVSSGGTSSPMHRAVVVEAVDGAASSRTQVVTLCGARSRGGERPRPRAARPGSRRMSSSRSWVSSDRSTASNGARSMPPRPPPGRSSGCGRGPSARRRRGCPSTADDDVEVEGLARVDRLEQVGEPGGVGADLVDQVVERSMMSPVRLEILTSSPSRSSWTSWPMMISSVVGVVAERLRWPPQPGHVAVVVGAPDVDERSKPRANLSRW